MTRFRFRAWHADHQRMYSPEEIGHDATALAADGTGFVNNCTMTPNLDTWPERAMIPLQSTGLRDRNGVEVFEGDILDFDQEEWGSPGFRSVVTWDVRNACWNWGAGTASDVAAWRAVVGNIYANLKLIPEP